MLLANLKKSPFSEQQQRLLLRLARQAIQHATETGEYLSESSIKTRLIHWLKENEPDQASETIDQIIQPLTEKACCFVTLHTKPTALSATNSTETLRGCIGALQAYQPLMNDVAEHAVDAALKDSRFPKVTKDELASITIDISILTPQQALWFKNEQDLLKQMIPNEDGITIEEGPHRATFLPSVWKQLTSKQEFLDHLKLKAGLPSDYWSSTIKAFRYHSITIKEI